VSLCVALLAAQLCHRQVRPRVLKTALKKISYCDILSRVCGSLAQGMEQNLQRVPSLKKSFSM
jgi:hypothetical protein